MKRLILRCALLLSLVQALTGCGGSGGSGTQSAPESAAVKLPPAPSTVSFTVPSANATAVSTNTAIMATFNEELEPATLTSSTFLVEGVNGSVAYDATNRTAIFTPAASLQSSTRYTAVVTTGVRSKAGVPLAEEYRWSFTTGSTADSAAPSITSVIPAQGATEVPGSTSVSATFSEIMDPTTLTAANVSMKDAASGIVPCTVNYSGRIVTLTPALPLQQNTSYSVTIASPARDMAGNPLSSDYSWTFTTGNLADSTAPTVVRTTPAADAVSVEFNRMIAATFSEPVSVGTVTTKSFTLRKGSLFVPGIVAYINGTALFAPLGILEQNTAYIATLTTDVKDLSGNSVTQDYNWSFSTGSSADTTAATVIRSVPANGETGVILSTRGEVTFSEDMNPFLLGAVDGLPAIVTYDFLQRTYSVIPAADLRASSSYNASIRARDLAGNVTDYSWSFNTGAK